MTKDWEKSFLLKKVGSIADPFESIVAQKTNLQVIGFNAPKSAAIDLGPEQGLVFESSPLGGPYSSLQFKSFAFSQVSEEQSWIKALSSLQFSLHGVNQQLASLREEIRELRGTRILGVEVSSLAPEPFEILRPISVTLEGGGDNFTATYFEANVSASGDTESDAIANFKDSLISKFEILEGTPETALGPLPHRQWQILRTLIRRVS